MAKPHIDMNKDLRKAAKTDFENEFFKLMNNRHRAIKLVTTKKWNYFVSEQKYHTTKFFIENLLAITNKNYRKL